jgi:hypothetical protein
MPRYQTAPPLPDPEKLVVGSKEQAKLQAAATNQHCRMGASTASESLRPRLVLNWPWRDFEVQVARWMEL